MTDDRQTPTQRKPANVRTALILLSVAVLFFAGVIAKRVLFG